MFFNDMTKAAAMVCGGVLLAGATTASAATVTFDLTGADSGWKSSLDYSQDGIDLTVTAFDDGNNPSAKVATWSGAGLGVRSHLNDTSHKVDSKGSKETVVFSFLQDVAVRSLTFGYFDNADDFDFLVDTGTGLNWVLSDDVAASFAFSAEYVGSVFGVSARDAYRCGQNNNCGNWPSSFKITSITVASELPAAVPLPAGGLLLLGALGGLAALRRKFI